MDNSQSASFNAGQAQGQATVKKDQIVDKASNAAQSVKDSMSEVRNIAGQAGQAVMDKASGAADAVKDATGMKK
ncbi:hypothetical protein FRX31_029269 [Thalictrum thalictroides]|uniref:Stress-induced protein KIN2-like n=1 Tax=Thalictrum thalictroides TaxID=46969 RepID=A0A7J6VAE4_THATH|nr:hypothetical protein FRX31_029269 [Thalictrum thalictroides]